LKKASVSVAWFCASASSGSGTTICAQLAGAPSSTIWLSSVEIDRRVEGRIVNPEGRRRL
jgi:hypothetical protein